MGKWMLRILGFEVVAILVAFPLMVAFEELLSIGTVGGVAFGLVVHYIMFFGLILYDIDWDLTHENIG